MRPHQIVIGQPLTAAKRERARELRREMTPEERRLWQHLRAHRLRGLDFRRQQVLHGFIVDFYCHAVGVIIEVDGPIHDEQAEYDADRDYLLASRGLRILRLKNEEIHTDLKEVLERIAAFCLEGVSESLPRPLPNQERGDRGGG
jgi:very-short-patch-repair endonuclease